MRLTRGDGCLRIEMEDDGAVHVDHLDRLVRWRGCSYCLDLVPGNHDPISVGVTREMLGRTIDA